MKRKCIIGIIVLIPILFSSVCYEPVDISTNSNKSKLGELGHYFFYDVRLSYNLKKSCSSCHDPSLAFSDGYRLSLNSDAEMLKRNSSSILNINHRTCFDWANPQITSLKEQMKRPLFSEHPIELGFNLKASQILERFKSDRLYQSLYKSCYGKDISNLNLEEIIDCIVVYELSLQSRFSIYDQFLKTNDTLIFTDQELMGYRLFFSDSISCHRCHGGLDFVEPTFGPAFANIGLYNCNGSYPIRDRGQYEHSKNYSDDGVFRIPTLRNVAITGPYYHDGSGNSLEEVILNYEHRGRNLRSGDCIGDGSFHPNVDSRLKQFQLDRNKRKALIAFLHTLTDTSYLSNPYFLDPFNE